MVAYSFRTRFVAPILAGAKRQTIRAARKRHARPGDELQHYTGMRTKHCKLIGVATCADVRPITILFDDDRDDLEGVITKGWMLSGDLDEFARLDGFSSWADLKAFWRAEHPGVDEFDGTLIMWGPLAHG